MNIRENLRKRFPGLKTALDRVLDKSGQIVRLQHIALMNKEMDDQANKSASNWQEGTRKDSIDAKHMSRLDRSVRLKNIENQEVVSEGGSPTKGLDARSQF